MAADQLVLGSGTNSVFLYLKPDGRWYRPGGTTPASNTVLRAGEGYYYYHSGTGFTWQAEE